MSTGRWSLPKLELGRVLRQSFALPWANPGRTIVLLLLVVALPAAAIGEIEVAVSRPAAVAAWAQWANAGLYILTRAGLEATFLHAFAADLRGHRASVGACLRVAVRRLPILLATMLIAAAAIAAGLVLLIVPGLMVAMAFAAAGGPVVLDGAGPIAALRRSAELTRGHRWRIFAIYVGTNIGLLAWQYGFSWGLYLTRVNWTGTLQHAYLLLIFPFYYVVGAVLTASVGAALNLELRRLHGGVDAGSVGDVFD